MLLLFAKFLCVSIRNSLTAGDFANKDVNELKEIVDRGKEKLQSGIIVLGSNNEKAIFVAGVTKDLVSKVKAGDIVKVAAQVTGGNGGGRPDFAQAGGKDGNAVEQAVKKAFEYITSQLRVDKNFITFSSFSSFKSLFKKL